MKKLCWTILFLILPILAFGLPSIDQIRKQTVTDEVLLHNIETKALKGDAFSQARLGEELMFGGIGLFPNYERALYWLNKSAAQKNPIAYMDLAQLYDQGAGVYRDDFKAKQYYHWAFKGLQEKIAKKDYVPEELPIMQYNLAKIYFWGVGDVTKPDMDKAFTLILASANAGYGPAVKAIAVMYRYGLGTDSNPVEAFKWNQLLAQMGVKEAQYLVGLSYLNGIGVKKDRLTAIYWIQKSAQNYYYPAISMLINLKDRGLIDDLPNTEIQSFENFVGKIISQSPYPFK